jgi:hypothetical protein
LVGGLCVLALAGCITAPEQPPPAWFTAANNADAGSYPTLQSVPRTVTANVDAAYWARHQRELVATGQAVKAHPRGVWAPAEDPTIFMNEARAALDATRASHE